jgi:hypothetical protein
MAGGARVGTKNLLVMAAMVVVIERKHELNHPSHHASNTTTK